MGIGENVGEYTGSRTGSSGVRNIGGLEAPTNFQIIATSSNSLTVSWDPPPQGSATGYRVKDATGTLKSESWGQKHFMIRDPQGLIIDVVEHLPQ